MPFAPDSSPNSLLSPVAFPIGPVIIGLFGAALVGLWGIHYLIPALDFASILDPIDGRTLTSLLGGFGMLVFSQRIRRLSQKQSSRFAGFKPTAESFLGVETWNKRESVADGTGLQD